MIEEHTRLAKTIGKRAIWVRSIMLYPLPMIDGLSGDHCATCCSLFRLASSVISYFLDFVSRRLRKKHYISMATHFVILTDIYPLLRSSLCGSLSLV